MLELDHLQSLVKASLTHLQVGCSASSYSRSISLSCPRFSRKYQQQATVHSAKEGAAIYLHKTTQSKAHLF